VNKTWGRAVAVLAVGTLMLAGCGGDDEPTATPTPSGSASTSASASPSSSGSSSASTSPSPSATPSSSAAADVPAAARARTEAGAIAFLQFWFDEFSRGLVDPQNAPDLFAISDKDCIGCKKSQDLINEYASGGWAVKQQGMRVVRAGLATGVDEPKVIINFTLEEISQPLYRNGKLTTNKVPAASVKKGAALKWVNGAWQAYDFENL